MERRILSIAVFLLLLSSALVASDSRGPQAAAQTGRTAVCSPLPPPPCTEGVSPGVIQVIPDGSSPANKSKLARKRFYLSSCPFNLTNNVNVSTAPTLRSFYDGGGASAQLIAWLKENHCETIYCRDLTMNEAKCDGIDSTKCVPEFNAAYRNALSALKGDENLALKMITNYAPLSGPKLRIGFYQARTEWLKNAVGRIESAVGSGYRIRSTMTDKDGVAFFYDLCPGDYYVSSIAPIEIASDSVLWESVLPIRVKGPLNNYTVVQLLFPPGENTSSRKIFGQKIALK